MLDSAAGLTSELPADAAEVGGKNSVSGTAQRRDTLRLEPFSANSVANPSEKDNTSPSRRQRRRLGEHEFSPVGDPSPNSLFKRRGRRLSHTYSSLSPVAPITGDLHSSSIDSSSDSEAELAGAVGQLSLNEDEQVRFHGKASGLHLLNDKERIDGRNEGGIWCVLSFLNLHLLNPLQAFSKSTSVASCSSQW